MNCIVKNPAVAGLFCAFSFLIHTAAATAQEAPTSVAPLQTPVANAEPRVPLESVSVKEATDAQSTPVVLQASPLKPGLDPSLFEENLLLNPPAPDTDNALNLPQEAGTRIAFLLPAADSPLEGPTKSALQGLLAANYASANPVQVLLIRPGSDNSVVEQLKTAARSGAQAAVGPLDRRSIEEISRLNYLPLPLVTLNEIALDDIVPMTEEEIVEERRLREERKQTAALEESTQRAVETQGASLTEVETGQKQPVAPLENVVEPSAGRIADKTKVPGLVLSDEIELPFVHRRPRLFPRNMLMLGMSMEHEAEFVARLGVAGLPATTESGGKPKVLLIDHDTHLEKRVSEAFEQELIRLGFTPDRLTVNLQEFTRLRKFFELVVEKLNAEEFDEVPIDQEADPVGWRKQQIRIRRLQAAKRARVALSEPPYYAAFLAMDAKNASLVRSRLPIRTRVWATSLTSPGDTQSDSAARAMTYDLLQVGLVDSPMILQFNADTFEGTYQVPVPETTLDKRLFALGADAFALSQFVARGVVSTQIQGLLGTLSYNLDYSPRVDRRPLTAMIEGGAIKVVSEQELVNFEVLRQSRRLRAQSRSLERLTQEAEEAAKQDGTLVPTEEESSDTPSESFDLQVAPQAIENMPIPPQQ